MQKKLLGSSIGFHHKRSIAGHIFCICQTLEKEWEYNGVHQLLIDFKTAYDSDRRESCIIFSLSLIPNEPGKANKMCLNEIYSTAQVDKHLSDMFLINNHLKQDDLSPLLFNFALKYTIRRVQVKQDGLKLNGTRQLMPLMLI